MTATHRFAMLVGLRRADDICLANRERMCSNRA
jgi:hypothetical protein